MIGHIATGAPSVEQNPACGALKGMPWARPSISAHLTMSAEVIRITLRRTPPMPEMTPNPGTREAAEKGCTCPTLDNEYGRGYHGEPGVFVYNLFCPVHHPKEASDVQ